MTLSNAAPNDGGGSRTLALARLLVGAALVVAVVLALLLDFDVFGDPERRAIERTRAAHLLLAERGLPLPGTPDLADLNSRLAASGLSVGAPVLVRIFKREFELELWMARDGRFQRFATYPICRWSGWLGPKMATGDRQAPEGFYTVATGQMNPNSHWHRSFDLGFPNAFDSAHGRTGSVLMVHGGCASAGCYAMTNAAIDEIWRLTSAALAGKQKAFQVQVFPFRLTPDNLTAHAASANVGFWQQLKEGSDLFETTLLPPLVSSCGGRYRFKAGVAAETAGPVSADCGSSRTTDRAGPKKAL